jgi:hypothetical protein
MAMTVTIVVTVQDTKFGKSKHATATAGQESSLHVAGEAAVDAIRHALGNNAVNAADVALTSVTVA